MFLKIDGKLLNLNLCISIFIEEYKGIYELIGVVPEGSHISIIKGSRDLVDTALMFITQSLKDDGELFNLDILKEKEEE